MSEDEASSTNFPTHLGEGLGAGFRPGGTRTKRRRSEECGEFDSHVAKRHHQQQLLMDDDGDHHNTTEEEEENDEDEDDDSEWDEELHDRFVSAIFEVGLKNASPAIILENMTQKLDSITSERVKSKLQKYRNSKEKSRDEFMEEYRSFLQRAKAMESAGGFERGRANIGPSSLLKMMGSRRLLGGDLAGYLTFVVTKGKEASHAGESDGALLSSRILRRGAEEYVDAMSGSPIPFPILSEDEKKTSLGVAMTFVMGLFLSMSQYLTRERARAETLGLKQPSNTTTTTASTNMMAANTTTPAAVGRGGNASSSGQVQSRLYLPFLEAGPKAMVPVPIPATGYPYVGVSPATGNGHNNSIAISGQSFGSIAAVVAPPDSRR